jgi:hypothetical protein
MLPNEHQPLALSAAMQQIKDQYAAMGFQISPRPFAEHEKHLYFFASRPQDNDPKQHYSINLHTGSMRVMGEGLTLVLSQAQQRFGNGEPQGVSPRCDTPESQPADGQETQHGGLTPSRSPEMTPTPPERTVVPPPAKAETVQQQAETVRQDTEKPAVPVSRERPAVAAESGKAATAASPVKRKQTALF